MWSTSSPSRRLAELLSQPDNRTCADCRVALIDPSQVYVSLSPLPDIPRVRYNMFLSNHANLAPPGVPRMTSAATPTIVESPPVDPALVVTARTGGHGIFVCAMCDAAHKLLRGGVIVHAVQDTEPWTTELVDR